MDDNSDKTSANLTSIPPFSTSTSLPNIVPQSVAPAPAHVSPPAQPSVLPQAPTFTTNPAPLSTTFPSVSNVAAPPMNSNLLQAQFSSASGQMHSSVNVPTSVPLYSTPSYPQPFTMPTSSMPYQPGPCMYPNNISSSTPQTMQGATVFNPSPIGQHMPSRIGQSVSPTTGQNVPPPTSISSYFSNDNFGVQKTGPQTSARGMTDPFSSSISSQNSAGKLFRLTFWFVCRDKRCLNSTSFI